MQKNKQRPEAWIIIPDMQVPFHDKRSLAAVEKFMAAHRWDGYLNIGDFMDFDQISSFNKNNLRAIEGRKILKDYEVGNEILDRHQKIIRKKNPDAKFVLIEGNHEYRIERYIDANPQVEGLFEVEHGLKLKERGFEWVRNWTNGDMYTVGKANFVHGQYTSKYHASKMVDNYGDNIFYGHTHDVQSYARTSRGRNTTQVGQSLGCLCTYELSYIKKNPSNWQQAFGVFYFTKGGFFSYYIPRIFSHKFVAPDGVEYSG